MPTSFFFKPIRFLLLVLLSFVFASTAFAANAVRWDSLKQAYFQHIPLDGPVNVFAQDHDDFIWLVAGNTLWRWDAYQLTPAIAPSDQKNLLVQTIKADSDGVLWVGTAKGLFRMSRDSLQMQRVNVQGLNALSIQHLAFDYSGGKRRAFIASVNTLFEWDMGGENIRAHAIAGTQSNRIHALQLNDAGQLWLGTTEGLLQKTISGSVSGNLYRASQWPGNTRVATLFTSQDKKLWIGTTKYGLFSIDKKQQLEKITLPTNKSEQPWVYSINEIRPGILWLGTFGSGIIEYDCEHKTFKTIQHNRLLKTSLHDDNVWTLFRDRRGLIWVGGGQGVNLYDATQSAFINIPGDINAKGISDAKIQSVMAMPDDRLWLGTQKHGIEIINPMQSDIQRIPEGIGGSSNLSSDPIEAMMLTDSKKVLASNNWLTFILDSNSYDAKFLRPEGRAPDGFSSAFASYQGSTWIAGTDGLWRMPDIQSAKAKNVFNSVPGERRIASLLADGDVLWHGKFNYFLVKSLM